MIHRVYDVAEIPDSLERIDEVRLERAMAEVRCSCCGRTIVAGERFARGARGLFRVECATVRRDRP